MPSGKPSLARTPGIPARLKAGPAQALRPVAANLCAPSLRRPLPVGPRRSASVALRPAGWFCPRPEYRPLWLVRSAACSALGVALDPPCSSRLRSVGTAFAAPHAGQQTRAQQSCSRSGVPQRQVRQIRSAVGLRQILGLLVTPAGTRQPGRSARKDAACRKSRCPPSRSATGIRPAPRRTDDVAPRRGTARARKAQGRAVVTVAIAGLPAFRSAQRAC
jgi:hypothetical protein